MAMTAMAAALPFMYVRTWRYYQGAKVLSYLFGVLAPMMLYAYLSAPSFRWSDFLVGWLLFWTFYEIGYLFNDCRSVVNEERPTHRAPLEVQANFKSIIVFRCVLLIAGAFLAARYTELHIGRLMGLTALTAIVFTMHNTLTDYRYRFVTLIVLSVLQPSFVIYVIGLEVAPYIFLLLPYLALKYSDYLFSKGLAQVNLREDLRLRGLLFTAWIGPVMLLGPKFLLVYAFIYINNTKHFYWEAFVSTAVGRSVAKAVPLDHVFGRAQERCDVKTSSNDN